MLQFLLKCDKLGREHLLKKVQIILFHAQGFLAWFPVLDLKHKHLCICLMYIHRINVDAIEYGHLPHSACTNLWVIHLILCPCCFHTDQLFSSSSPVSTFLIECFHQSYGHGKTVHNSFLSNLLLPVSFQLISNCITDLCLQNVFLPHVRDEMGEGKRENT